jgi:hypothetical protein
MYMTRGHQMVSAALKKMHSLPVTGELTWFYSHFIRNAHLVCYGLLEFPRILVFGSKNIWIPNIQYCRWIFVLKKKSSQLWISKRIPAFF